MYLAINRLLVWPWISYWRYTLYLNVLFLIINKTNRIYICIIHISWKDNLHFFRLRSHIMDKVWFLQIKWVLLIFWQYLGNCKILHSTHIHMIHNWLSMNIQLALCRNICNFIMDMVWCLIVSSSICSITIPNIMVHIWYCKIVSINPIILNNTCKV